VSTSRSSPPCLRVHPGVPRLQLLRPRSSEALAMTANGWLQILVFAVAVLAITKPAGLYILRVYDGSMRWLAPLERSIYRVCGIDPDEDQHWTRYAAGLLLFSAVSMLATYVALRLQDHLPLNPFARGPVPTARRRDGGELHTIQTGSLLGETTMSYFSQTTQLAFHNFASAAVGVAAAIALARGIARRAAGRIGNFWTDLVRGRCTCFCLHRSSWRCCSCNRARSRTSRTTSRQYSKGRSRSSPWSCGKPDGDQAAGHQRGRILQRQCGASVRESHAVDELFVGVHDLRHSRGLTTRSADGEEQPEKSEHRQLLKEVWGQTQSSIRIYEVYMTQLRHKLEKDATDRALC